MNNNNNNNNHHEYYEQNGCNTVFPRDIVSLRNISKNTLHKGDDDDDDDDNNNIRHVTRVFLISC